ncbi:MAG: hypothetical protein HYY84_11050 [Deltaproteobacteria bacterium]|nr:hypothetical protein [Deltaproteobacteria bacterium]
MESFLGLLVVVPAVLGGLAYFLRRTSVQLALLLAVAIAHLAGVIALWFGPHLTPAVFHLRVDPIGLLFLTTTSVLFVAASLYSIAYVRGDTHDEPSARHRFVPFLLWFLATMTLVTLAEHLALLWAAVEATTLASAPLIYYYRRRAALEATWKYLLICSVGIALALLGTFFLGIAASATPGEAPALSLPALMDAAPQMAKPWLRAAFILALVGYGTKMGLAPLHTWLPDAHSQAPSPVSALLSGALLNCAFLGILRFYQVCVASGDSAFAETLLIVLGVASLIVAAAFLIRQRDVKRLFAYSSVENMGILAIGVGIGGKAAFAALLHAVNHSLCKAALFFVAGNVLRAYGTTRASDVTGALRRLPITGTLLVVGVLAIGGLPPFGAFVSEYMIFNAALATGHTVLGVLFISLLAVAFLGMAMTVFSMAQGEGHSAGPEAPLAVLPSLIFLSIVLLLGLYLPPALSDLLSEAAKGLER